MLRWKSPAMMDRLCCFLMTTRPRGERIASYLYAASLCHPLALIQNDGVVVMGCSWRRMVVHRFLREKRRKSGSDLFPLTKASAFHTPLLLRDSVVLARMNERVTAVVCVTVGVYLAVI